MMYKIFQQKMRS